MLLNQTSSNLVARAVFLSSLSLALTSCGDVATPQQNIGDPMSSEVGDEAQQNEA